MSRDILRARLTDAGHKLTGARDERWEGRAILGALLHRNGLEAAREAETWERHRQLKFENEKAEGTHWHKEECLAFIASILQPVRQRLLALPTTQAALCNPQDPPHAHQVLSAYLAQLLPTLRQDMSAASETFEDHED